MDLSWGWRIKGFPGGYVKEFMMLGDGVNLSVVKMKLVSSGLPIYSMCRESNIGSLKSRLRVAVADAYLRTSSAYNGATRMKPCGSGRRALATLPSSGHDVLETSEVGHMCGMGTIADQKNFQTRYPLPKDMLETRCRAERSTRDTPSSSYPPSLYR